MAHQFNDIVPKCFSEVLKFLGSRLLAQKLNRQRSIMSDLLKRRFLEQSTNQSLKFRVHHPAFHRRLQTPLQTLSWVLDIFDSAGVRGPKRFVGQLEHCYAIPSSPAQALKRQLQSSQVIRPKLFQCLGAAMVRVRLVRICPCQKHSARPELFVMFMACLMPAEPSPRFHSTLLQSISLQRRQRLEELLVVFFSAKIHSKVQGNQVRILLKNLGFLTRFVCLTIRPITPFYICIYSNYITRFRIIWNKFFQHNTCPSPQSA